MGGGEWVSEVKWIGRWSGYTKVLSKGSALGVTGKCFFWGLLNHLLHSSLLISFSFFNAYPLCGGRAWVRPLAFSSFSRNSIPVVLSAASLWLQPQGFIRSCVLLTWSGLLSQDGAVKVTCLLGTAGLEVGIQARASLSCSLFVGAREFHLYISGAMFCTVWRKVVCSEKEWPTKKRRREKWAQWLLAMFGCLFPVSLRSNWIPVFCVLLTLCIWVYLASHERSLLWANMSWGVAVVLNSFFFFSNLPHLTLGYWTLPLW